MLQEFVAKWRSQTDFMKLQSAYGVGIVVSLVAGGLVGLLNQAVAWQLLSLTWILIIAFSVNLVSFALINLIAEPPVKPVRRVSPQKKRR